MKKFLFGFILGIIICISLSVIAQYVINPNPFDIIIDGKKASIEGYNINDNSYFKLRDIGQAVGFEVGFESNAITIKTKEGGKQVNGENIDGAIVYDIGGTRYVKQIEIKLPQTYKYKVDSKEKKLHIINKETKEIVLENILFFLYEDDEGAYLTYIPYDYYLEHILPLLEE